ncbi:Alpha/beta hydrolase fold-1 [Irpex rosettiformis]|uniref:Alpha/beta hydrolase fold-1 n=1 Tax=Irpex rosettiformis TaxID=378272 RepID=A0ACB8UFT4_9APHY|nr:Alpha/beta hydrolase fold-1 [Irpex rosettiformis]
MQRPRFTTLTLPADADYPFNITANCYPHPNFEHDRTLSNHNAAALTLIVLHSTSFHKEALEPMLADVFLFTASKTDIREAWIIECPNHGESGVQNQDVLKMPEYVRYFSCERYAEAARRFLLADIEGGPRARVQTDKIVGIGHSLGGCAIVCLANELSIFTSLVLLDPFLLPIPEGQILSIRKKSLERAKKKKSSWPSMEAVKAYLERRRWNEQVKELFAAYGVHKSEDQTSGSQYTLSCTQEQEVTMYSDEDGAIKPMQYLNKLCSQFPVHIAFGEEANVVPKGAREALVNVSGRQFASIGRIEGAGHLIPQESPRGAARFIVNALCQNSRL